MIRFDKVAHGRSTIRSIMNNLIRPVINVAKRLLQFSHSSIEEMRKLLTHASMFTNSHGMHIQKYIDNLTFPHQKEHPILNVRYKYPT